MRPSALLRGLVVGTAVLYLGLGIGFTLAFVDDVPTAAWVGFGVVALVVTALATATIVLFERIDSRAGVEGGTTAPRASDGRQRVLVVADVGCAGADVCPYILSRIRSRSNAEVFVVAPAIASPLHHLMDDEGRERATAGRRLDEIVSLLKTDGVKVQGMVGSDLPLEAIHDALAVFPADEIVILAPPAEMSAWSERDLVERVRSTFGRPVTEAPVKQPA
jgi:hypothetical protein